jgi:hypothetical protein
MEYDKFRDSEVLMLEEIESKLPFHSDHIILIIGGAGGELPPT